MAVVVDVGGSSRWLGCTFGTNDKQIADLENSEASLVCLASPARAPLPYHHHTIGKVAAVGRLFYFNHSRTYCSRLLT